MKRRNRFGLELLSGMLFAFLFCVSCTDDSIAPVKNNGGTGGKKVRIMLSSSLLQTSGGTSRSTGEGMNVLLGGTSGNDTRVVTEDKIDNVCVFQFAGSAESSTAVLKSKYYVSGLVDRTLDVPLISSTECFLYFCANVGDITADYTVDSSTYLDLMNTSLTVSGQGDFSSLLPMCGASATLDLTTLSGSIDVALTRLVAKVSFTCDLSSLPAGDSFSFINATLRNVPKSVGYVASATGTLTSTTTVDSYVGTGATVDETAKTTTYVWYMPENLRGTGTTISAWQERTSKNAPVYSTYLELTGYYTPSGGEATWASYVVYLGNASNMDNYDVERNHTYSVTATIKGVNLADGRVSTSTDLSADGLSNCYLASTSNHWYRFTGTTRGNGNTTDYTSTYTGISIMPSAVSGASDAVTIPAAQIADAVIVWETSQGLINQVQWDAESGCVKFKTGDTTAGNAVIAVRNASGTILWSWHIWRTAFDLATLNENHALQIKTNTNYDWYGELVGTDAMRERDLVMMDRNLGTSGTDWSTNQGVNSLHYQFGRKDPLPGGGTVESSGGDITLYGYGSDELGTPFTIFDKMIGTTILRSESYNTAQKTIDYTIQHPEAFIYTNITPEIDATYNQTSAGNNWIYTAILNSPDWEISNSLWGDNNLVGGSVNDGYLDPAPWDGPKTIYDPCPAGWRVAPADAFTGVAHDITNGQTSNNDLGWKSVDPTINIYNNGWSTGWTFRFGSESTDASAYFPASGYRRVDGLLNTVGTLGCDWVSSPGGATDLGASHFGFTLSIVYVAYKGGRALGCPVRCVQE